MQSSDKSFQYWAGYGTTLLFQYYNQTQNSSKFSLVYHENLLVVTDASAGCVSFVSPGVCSSQLCPLGTYSSSLGTYSSSHFCKRCPANTTSVALGSESCSECAAGSYLTAPGVCTRCISGTVYDKSTGFYSCSKSYYSCGSADGACLGEAGDVCSSAECVHYCSAGKYGDSEGCHLCAVGSYSSTAGSLSCAVCPVNTTTFVAGFTSCLYSGAQVVSCIQAIHLL